VRIGYGSRWPAPAGVIGAASAATAFAQSTAPPIQVSAASPDLHFRDLLDNYAQTGRGWKGADRTYSVPLPGGRDLWLFSNTFLGPVGPETKRPLCTRLFTTRSCCSLMRGVG